MKKWEASWLAGVIDSDGSIGLYDYGKAGRRVQIQVGNVNREFLQHVRDVIGCGSIVQWKATKTHRGRQQMYAFTVKGSNRCYWIIRQILPFLIIKRSSVLTILDQLHQRPFGRWANATPETRKLQSDRLKQQWLDPVFRSNRLEKIRSHHVN